MTIETTPHGNLTNGSSPFALTLSEAVEISGIEALYQLMQQGLSATPSELIITAEAVGRIDAASLQLLAVLCREARSLEMTVTWRKPSSALLRSAQLLGLTEVLELKEAA